MQVTENINWQQICLIGLGSQGSAWACNLRDSGRDIEVYLRPNSSSHQLLEKLRLKAATQLNQYQVFLLLIPDEEHKNFLEQNAHKLRQGTSIIYAHGASISENALQELYPHLNHLLLAPKAIASEVRFQYERGGKLGAVYSVEHAIKETKSQVLKETLNLAKDLGITAGPFEASFHQEACADLFSEQSLLCGLIPYAAKHSFDKLIQSGISAELAYMECWLEVKLIADAMVKHGPSGLFKLISPHALKGAEIAQERFFDKEYHKHLERLLDDIEGGGFFKSAQAICIDSLRKEAHKYWSESLLQKVHDELKKDLVP